MRSAPLPAEDFGAFAMVAFEVGLRVRVGDAPAAGAADDAKAQRSRGPKWESFYVPVREGMLRSGENVLALEVRPTYARLAPIVDLSLEASEEGHVVRGPIVQRVGETRATIVFE